jgi:CheY-like chemotaxis protein
MVTDLGQRKPTILYIEDEGLIAVVVVEMLEDAGYDVIHAPDGQKAMTVLEAQAPDLAALVTDVRLPDGIKGWEIAHHARELNPALPVVYVSGDSAAEWAAHGVPNSLMLQKPFADGQLLAAVTTLLNDAAGRLPQS